MATLRRSRPYTRPRVRRGGAAAGRLTPIEMLVESVLHGEAPRRRGMAKPARDAMRFDTRDIRVAVLGGGTGLSSIVGGNSQSESWADNPFVGLKEEFPRLDVIVVTTDDGGSTGLLLKELPMIGIGDMRKSCLSMIRSESLRRTYRLDGRRTLDLVRLIRRIFTYRFPAGARGSRLLRDPLLAAPPALRAACPASLCAALRRLGRFLSPGGRGPTIRPAGHCMGNLLLTAAIFAAADGRADRPPGPRAIRSGVDEIARLMGAPAGRLHAATSTPGQLRILYANGVEVCGQHKASAARRGFPVRRLTTEFSRAPAVSAAVLRALREADVIIYAPGSLYTSMLPLLQIPPILDAIRSNRKALKLLAANFWIQEGETDIPPGDEKRGFLVSDLIAAYDRNMPGGARGLFDIALSANLERLPGSILRSYALEGKLPIHLDRERVEAMGIQPVEATLFRLDKRRLPTWLHHDPANFALAVRGLIYARRRLGGIFAPPRRAAAPRRPARRIPVRRRTRRRGPILRDYASAVARELDGKSYRPRMLRRVLEELAWENRDISPAHLRLFRGARIIPAKMWGRSAEWDNVLGYHDERDCLLKVHEQLLDNPERLKEDLLIALGESLLGRYIEKRRWLKVGSIAPGARCYEIVLRPAGRRRCLLSDAQLRRYLECARMIPDESDRRVYRITINGDEGFLPPGLLFGLTYAWYLNNAYGGVMEYEMSLLRWPPESLIPHHAKERLRKQALVSFFREDIFGNSAKFSVIS